MSEVRIQLRVEETFSASHWLADYQGNCANRHGHTWLVQADFIFRGQLDHCGIAIDFKILKAALHTALDGYDHADLNIAINPEGKKVQNPTAENLAKIIFHKLTDLHLQHIPDILNRGVIFVEVVTVYERLIYPRCSVRYGLWNTLRGEEEDVSTNLQN